MRKMGSVLNGGLPLLLLVGMTACTPEKLEFNSRERSDVRSQVAAPMRLEWIAGENPGDKTAVFSGRVNFRGALSPAVIRSLFPDGAELERLDPRATHPLFRLRYLGGKSVPEVIRELEGERSIEWAEPDYLIEGHQVPVSDPEFMKSWSLANFGQTIPNGVEGKSGADIHWAETVSTATGSREVIVALLDTGIDYLHPELRENIYRNPEEANGMLGRDDDHNGFTDDTIGWDFAGEDADPMDENGHGTHAAGIIGAARENGIGSAGINDQVSLLPLKVLNRDGSGSVADAYRAIQYGVRRKVHIISSSWGGAGNSKLMKAAVDDAAEAGILYVRSAGNEGINLDFRSSREVTGSNVMVVGASDAQDEVASFSNIGANVVDLFAPGVNIFSTTAAMGVSQTRGKDSPSLYRIASGTSTAVPHVTGVAALIMGQYRGLRYQAAMVKKRILDSSDRSLYFMDRAVSGGRLNAARALKNDPKPPQLGKWEEEDLAIRSPSFPIQMTDYRKEIKKEGAEAIRIHFRFVNIDRPFDSVAVYDGRSRLVFQAEVSRTSDFWTPPIIGDRATVRFTNARVRSETLGTQTGRSFANPASEGFAIDKIAIWKGRP